MGCCSLIVPYRWKSRVHIFLYCTYIQRQRVVFPLRLSSSASAAAVAAFLYDHTVLYSPARSFFFFFLTTARHKRLIRYSVDVHGGPIEQSTSGTIIRKIPSQPPRVPATLRAASFSRHDRAPVSRVSVYFIRERPTKGPYYYRKEYYTGRVQVYEHTRPSSSSSSTRPVIRRDVTETGYISCGYPTNICVYIYEI